MADTATASDTPVESPGFIRLPDGVEIFTEGDPLFDAMLMDIRAARRVVRFETYIFEELGIGERFLQAFMDKAEQGVRVVMRVDSAGSLFSLSRSAVRRLKRSGVQFRWSRGWEWRRPWSFGHRNHRKLLIIDQEAAYLGGFNVHRASSRRYAGALAWRDTHVRLPAPEVQQAVAAFDTYSARHQTEASEAGDYYVVATREHGRKDALRELFTRHFQRARNRIWVTTPYFVPDRRTQKGLIDAAQRGVDVRLLTPAKNDVPVAQWAARAAYTQLLAAGVRVFEYQPRVLHAKTVVVDDDWATIGSANLDYRSLFINDEINLASWNRPMNQALARIFMDDLEASAEVLAAPWKTRGIRARIAEFIGWMARRFL